MRSYPFSKASSSEALEHHLQGVLAEIRGLENEYVLKASPAELEEYYVDKASADPLILHVEDCHIEGQHQASLELNDYGRRIVRPATKVDIAIPYEGDKPLWQVRPSTWTLSGYPEIDVRDDSICLTVTLTDSMPDKDRLKREVDSQIGSLNGAVATLYKDVTQHNSRLPSLVRQAIADRRAQALAVSEAIGSLGIPLKRSDKVPSYAIPAVRRKPTYERPKVTSDKYAPEPFLEEAEYKHILDVARSMFLVMERNPQSFDSLDEEDIRNHFLIQLNGHYEGGATGETFNASGKTDILIRVRDRNVFVAECKLWRGPKSFDDAITQLLTYLSWRDSKSALLIFNRGGKSTEVHRKMHEVMGKRKEFRKCVFNNADGDSRYVLVKESDPGREITVTTQLFDLPEAKSRENA